MYLPAVMFLYDLLMGSFNTNSLAGFAAAHCFYYFHTIYPTQPGAGHPLATPAFMSV
jgi:hypothetical protein